MKSAVLILLTLFLLTLSVFSPAQVDDTAKVMKWKIEKSNCLFSYIKKGFIPQQELATINPDVSACATDTGRVVSFSVAIQKSPFIQDRTANSSYIDVWPDLVKLPKDAIIYIENIVFLAKNGTTVFLPTVKLIVQ